MNNTLARLQAGIVAGLTDYLDGNTYSPEPISQDNGDWLDGYSYGWSMALDASRNHAYSVKKIGGHGYPYRAVCPCGWQSTTYAAAHAAHTMGEEHVTAEAMETINRANRAK